MNPTTEQRQRYAGKYTSPEQITVLTSWKVFGPRSLDPVPRPGTENYRRRASLRAVRQMIEVFGLGPEYERLRLDVTNRDITRISPALRDQLIRQARVRSLVLPGGEEAVPLSGLQTDLLIRLAWGASLQEAGAGAGMAQPRKNPNNILHRMRHHFGCATTGHLIGMAYRARWFPDMDELEDLGLHPVTVLDADQERHVQRTALRARAAE